MRPKIPSRWISTFILLCLLALVTSACGEGEEVLVSQADFEQVSPLFREFYEHLGGMELLGPAISPTFEADGRTYQYTSSSLMVYDPLGPASERFRLAPLGLELGIAEPAIPAPRQAGLRYIDGHILYDGFASIYEKLNGARFIGRPITEVHFNPETRRYEQHFENLGLYQVEGEPPGTVHSMNYGSWKCSASCRQISAGNALVVLPPEVGDLFREMVARLGHDFTGYALTDPFTLQDGTIEQVFENVVLAVDPAKPGQVTLSPIAERLGILPDPLTPAASGQTLTFYPLEKDQGHNIPQTFIDYLALRGGLELSGPPLTELAQINEQIYRQCFANLCLEEHHNSSGSIWVRLAPLGYTYRSLGVPTAVPAPAEAQAETVVSPPSNEPEQAQPASLPEDAPESQLTPEVQDQPDQESFEDSQVFRSITLQLWETNPLISSNESQEIGVGIFENDLPLQAVEPDLVLTLPDGGSRSYYMLPTDQEGQTRVQIEPIQAQNGTLIPYQVCIANLNREKFCVRDSFLIWGNP